MPPCVYCFKPATLSCGGCSNPEHAYCSVECQEATKPMYEQLCKSIAKSPPPSDPIGADFNAETATALWVDLVRTHATLLQARTADEKRRLHARLARLLRGLSDEYRNPLPAEAPPLLLRDAITQIVARLVRPYNYQALHNAIFTVLHVRPTPEAMTEVLKRILSTQERIADFILDAYETNDVTLYLAIRTALPVDTRREAIAAYLARAFPNRPYNDLLLGLCQSENPSIAPIQMLLDVGADKNAADASGKTALMWVVIRGNPVAVNVLLNAGADLEATDSNGNTALILGAISGNLDTVLSLINAGAALNIQNNVGYTAIAIARRNGLKDIAVELFRAGAR